MFWEAPVGLTHVFSIRGSSNCVVFVRNVAAPVFGEAPFGLKCVFTVSETWQHPLFGKRLSASHTLLLFQNVAAVSLFFSETW